MERALAVLDRLHAEPGGLTLTQLSHALGISPSSLSAILRTLSAHGYVTREQASGRYRLGPAPLELADAESTAQHVWHAADAVADLARVIAAAGPTHTSGSASQREVLTTLGRSAQQLAALLLEASAAGPGDDAIPTVDASGPLTAAEVNQFLGGDCLATLSCVKDDGYPHSVPVWYQWEQSHFWLVSRSGAAWARYVLVNPRVSLTISEHQLPLRRVLVEGQAERVSGSDRLAQIPHLVAAMAARYLGARAAAYLASDMAQPQQLFAVRPERMVTWRGLAPHPRYGAAAQAQGRGRDMGVA